MKNIVILGATGSIGLQTLSVIEAHPELFYASVLVAHKNVESMVSLCAKYRPKTAIMADTEAAKLLQARLIQAGLSPSIQVLSGAKAIEEAVIAPDIDAVMCAMVGAVGILPTYRAICADKIVWLANKESLVVAGATMMAAVRRSKALLLPIDSEHNALFQCLPPPSQEHNNSIHGDSAALKQADGIVALWLTASGGPFLGRSRATLQHISPEEACNHPRWKMGPKISVDSATLVNKGLEVIEAHFLFAMPADKIHVVVHPQSIVHSMVEYVDGSFLAQLSAPDMRTPIAHAMGWPTRIRAPVSRLNPFELSSLTFLPPDTEAFPCLQLAFDALKQGGHAPLVLNAANEIAVEAFLNKKIRFLDIPTIIAEALSRYPLTIHPTDKTQIPDIHSVCEEDQKARRFAQSIVQRYALY